MNARIAPSAPPSRMRKSSKQNSRMTWRHTPQGGQKAGTRALLPADDRDGYKRPLPLADSLCKRRALRANGG